MIWGWIVAGALVVVLILGLSLRLNSKKSTAHLAVRLAEAYRSAGDFETARSLYEVAPDLDQNVEAAQEGKRRADHHSQAPVLDRALVEAARRRLVDEREQVQAHLDREGIDVELPPLETG